MPEDQKPGKYDDWTPEEKAEWDGNAKTRGRLLDELTEGLFTRLFTDPEGGERVDPDGQGSENPPRPSGEGGAPPAGGGGGAPVTKTPWFERALFGAKKAAGS